MPTIGVLSPGAMGAALGRTWQRGGARVVTTVAGRSPRTQQLAEGLEWLESVEAVVGSADVVVSVVPPARALDNAEQIATAAQRLEVRPVVADLNAISLPTLEKVAAVLNGAGCAVVDGSVSGNPPQGGGGADTRVYLSGEHAGVLTGLDSHGLRTRIAGPEVGQASALKMCTAAVYKGITALLIQSLRTADSHGVAELVAQDWADMLGPLGAEGPNRIAVAVAKSDRFPAEMREIATTQDAAGWGAELYEAIARIFEAAYHTRLGELTPEQADDVTELGPVLEALRSPRIN